MTGNDTLPEKLDIHFRLTRAKRRRCTPATENQVLSTVVCCGSTGTGDDPGEVPLLFLELFTPQSRTIINTMMPIAIGIRPGGKGLNKINIMTRNNCSAFQEVIVS